MRSNLDALFIFFQKMTYDKQFQMKDLNLEPFTFLPLG